MKKPQTKKRKSKIMKNWKLQAFDIKGNKLAVFSPSFKGNRFKEAFLWFSTRDFIINNPHIVKIEIEIFEKSA